MEIELFPLLSYIGNVIVYSVYLKKTLDAKLRIHKLEATLKGKQLLPDCDMINKEEVKDEC